MNEHKKGSIDYKLPIGGLKYNFYRPYAIPNVKQTVDTNPDIMPLP